MTGEPEANGAPRPSTDERAQAPDLFGLGEQNRDLVLTWVGEHLPEVRRSAYGQRSLYWTLGVGFVVGMATYVGGYALRASVTTEPVEFVGDLLYTLGWALWTGVVVVLFLQVLPETKKRGYKQALDAYEAAVGDQARTGTGRAPDPTGNGEGFVPPSGS